MLRERTKYRNTESTLLNGIMHRFTSRCAGSVREKVKDEVVMKRKMTRTLPNPLQTQCDLPVGLSVVENSGDDGKQSG